MPLRHFNFAVAIIASALLHVLLWPAATRLVLPRMTTEPPAAVHGEVTILLDDKPAEIPKPVEPPPPKPVPPVVEPPDDMGEAHAKGTGAQAAKGKDLLRAPEADQDQAFLSRDPVGAGRIGDPPTFFTGPRGEDGSGGQVGSVQAAANPAHAPSASEQVATAPPMKEPGATRDQPQDRPPVQSPVHVPEPEVPAVTPPKDVAPPPAKTAAIGSAVADVNLPPSDEIKSHGPLTAVASISQAELLLPSEEGPTTAPVKASSTAPPSGPNAPADRMSVAIAPQLSIPIAAVEVLPPPAVDVSLPKPKEKEAPAKTAAAPAAQALITTGDGRAPGRDRASADPAQESDSESDAFAKKLVSAVMHDGRLEVRDGRKVKTTRPHFLPGALGDFIANPNPVLVLKVSIDDHGNVIHDDIIQSTGSVMIDQPCKLAMRDWWFEPTHDKDGKAVPDVFPFEIRFR